MIKSIIIIRDTSTLANQPTTRLSLSLLLFLFSLPLSRFQQTHTRQHTNYYDCSNNNDNTNN